MRKQMIALLFFVLLFGCTATKTPVQVPDKVAEFDKTPRLNVFQVTPQTALEDSTPGIAPTPVSPKMSSTPDCLGFSDRIIPIEVDSELIKIKNRFLEEIGAESLEEIGTWVNKSDRYSDSWIVSRDNQTASVDLSFDVIILGSYWVGESDYLNPIGELPDDILQIIVFYSPEFDLVLQGLFSMESRNAWSPLPIIVKDNSIYLAMEGETDLDVSLTSKCGSQDWINDHIGGLATIRVYMYFEHIDRAILSDFLDQPILDLLLNPDGYVYELSNHIPNLNDQTIPIILKKVLDENPGLILMGISPYDAWP